MTNVRNAITAAVVKGVQEAVRMDETKTVSGDVPAIANKVLMAVEPVIAHATNNEPWYQSRVTIGSYIAMAAPVVGPLIGHSFSPEEQALITTVVAGILTIGGAGLALYGRWFAKKPLGA